MAVATRLAGALLYQEDDAASASGAAGFGGASALPHGCADEFVDQRSGDSGSIGAAQFPLFAQKAGDFFPLAAESA